MQTTTMTAPSISADHLSAILNLVCPECGGRMGARTNVFQCQGQCGNDWRSVWESASPNRRAPVSPKDRPTALAHVERSVLKTAVGGERPCAVSTVVPDGNLPSEALIASLGRDISSQTQALR